MTRLPALPGEGTAADVTRSILDNLRGLPALPPSLTDEVKRARALAVRQDFQAGAVALRPPAPTPPRCCWCGRDVARNAGSMFALTITGRRGAGEKLVLYWHQDGCLAADPLHDAWATAHNLPDDEAGDAACLAAYLAIRDRVAKQYGAAGLRACIDVRKDTPDPRRTLRGAGLAWGRATSRY